MGRLGARCHRKDVDQSALGPSESTGFIHTLCMSIGQRVNEKETRPEFLPQSDGAFTLESSCPLEQITYRVDAKKRKFRSA
ncbi:hypothetical protein F2P81_002228 [Scophthalmus maximus]|uniref:Uncharacterized protein n=1 Tax=Scophthalmus maximus TaxID=52904 RepID=A0A6A4TLI2_SCOMX|nr:hypothetical protein F2P81_002228 [Scophthalmus maximus]